MTEEFMHQLQELYFHLDHSNTDMYMTWYAQQRALEVPHKEAIDNTVEHFNLKTHDWYKLRLERAGIEC